MVAPGRGRVLRSPIPRALPQVAINWGPTAKPQWCGLGVAKIMNAVAVPWAAEMRNWFASGQLFVVSSARPLAFQTSPTLPMVH